MTDKFKIFLLGLLALSLILNLVSLSHLSGMKDQLDQLRSRNNSDLNYLSSQIASIISRMNQATQEAEMIVQQAFSVAEGSTQESVIFVVDFTLREVTADSEVSLLYKDDKTVSWQSAELESRGANSYSAVLNLNGNLDYQFVIQVGDRVEDPRWIYKSWFAPGLVYPESIGYSAKGKNIEMEVTLVSRASMLPQQLPAKITVRIFDGNNLKDTIDINPESPQPWHQEFSFPNNCNVTLEVIYADGTIHQGEIWPDESFMENMKGK